MQVRPLLVNYQMQVFAGNQRLRACKDLGWTEVPCHVLGWDEEKQRRAMIKDNISAGEWDQDMLANDGWDEELLQDWGVDIPTITETERLSSLEFEDVYYKPEDKPNLLLKDCLNLDKFNAKIKVIEDSELNDEQKKTMRWFAYRFIKIDFESVANYYFFNASEQEQQVIERLRLVLCDSGLQGFIEDDLLHVHDLVQGWGDD